MADITDMARDALEAAPLSLEDAAKLGRLYAAYALERAWENARRPVEHKRLYHPGVLSHLTAMRCQADAVVELLDPKRDQVRAAA